MVGGMVSEGRLCCWTPRLRVGVPRLVCGGPVEWREWWSRVVPLSRVGSGTPCIVLPSSRCLVPVVLSLFSLPFVWCRVCCGWGSAVVWSRGGMVCAVCVVCVLSCITRIVFAVTALLG